MPWLAIASVVVISIVWVGVLVLLTVWTSWSWARTALSVCVGTWAGTTVHIDVASWSSQVCSSGGKVVRRREIWGHRNLVIIDARHVFHAALLIRAEGTTIATSSGSRSGAGESGDSWIVW